MSREEDAIDTRLERVYEHMGLKDLDRTGWVLRAVRDPESVADHSWGTALLVLAYIDEARRLDGEIDLARALAIALVHDLAEVHTGDIPRRVDAGSRSVSGDRKRERERTAMRALCGGIDEFVALWEEYESSSSGEARFVRDMNLVDMCIQATRYEEQRRYDQEASAHAFPDFEAMDEFFATSGPRIATRIGRTLYDRVSERYRRLRKRYSDLSGEGNEISYRT